jgi:hypothetical protein
MIWLPAPPPKDEDKPPPLGFCTKTISTNNIDVMIIKIVKTVYILFV